MTKKTFVTIAAVKILIVIIFTYSNALASNFSLDILPGFFTKNFEQKHAAQELVSNKYPDIAADVLNLIENKYKSAQEKLPAIVHEAFCEDDPQAPLKLLAIEIEMINKNYDGSLSKFAERFAEEVLRKNPGIVDELLKKADENRENALSKFAGKIDPEKLKTEMKSLVEGKHGELIKKVRNAFIENAKKIPQATLFAFAADMKKLVSEKYPDIKTVCAEISEKHPKMKKPGVFFAAALKNPDFVIGAAKIIDGKYRSEIFKYLSAVISDLISEKINFFELRRDAASKLNENSPDIFFAIARHRIDAKKATREFMNSKYPGLGSSIAKMLDVSWPKLGENIYAAAQKYDPKAVSRITAAVRSAYPELENDIDQLLTNKYPKLLTEINSGMVK